jgi:hypothetical protein
MRINGRFEIPDAAIAEFCRKWRVTEFALFGSVLTDEFRPDSDVDVLLTFEEDAPWSLWDIIDLQGELEAIIGRKVDIAERPAVERSENYIRRRSILKSARTVYVA